MKTYRFILALFLLDLFSASVISQDYDGEYKVTYRFQFPDIEYAKENSTITVKGNEVDAEVDFELLEMRKPNSEFTEGRAVLSGNGKGRMNGNSLECSGNGNIQTYEKGKQDERINFSFTLRGNITKGEDENTVDGNIALINNGEVENGTFSGKCKVSKINLTLFLIIGGVVVIAIVVIVLILTLGKKKTPPPYHRSVPPMYPPANTQTYSPPPTQMQPPPPPVNTTVNRTFCDSCGAKLKENAKFCHICGKKF